MIDNVKGMIQDKEEEIMKPYICFLWMDATFQRHKTVLTPVRSMAGILGLQMDASGSGKILLKYFAIGAKNNNLWGGPEWGGGVC